MRWYQEPTTVPTCNRSTDWAHVFNAVSKKHAIAILPDGDDYNFPEPRRIYFYHNGAWWCDHFQSVDGYGLDRCHVTDYSDMDMIANVIVESLEPYRAEDIGVYFPTL